MSTKDSRKYRMTKFRSDYEKKKEGLRDKNLSPAEYEKEMRKLAKKLKI